MQKTRDLVVFYTKSRLESEVVRNYAGYLWWFLDPALEAMIYYVVFGLILNRGGPDFIQFLFVGITVWKWFQTTVQKGCMSIYASKSLYNRIYLPKVIFPWIELNMNTVKFLAVFGVMVVIYPCFGGYPVTRSHFYLPLLMACQFVFIIGLTTLLSSLTPFFPDSGLVIKHLLRLSFYPSGVFFSVKHVPEQYQFLVKYNPMASSIEGFRNILMYGKDPALHGLMLLSVIGAICYVLGMIVIRRADGEYAKLL